MLYQAAQLLIATAQLAYPNYAAESWHIYLVYVAMMFLSYVIICMPTRYVSWFNIWANILGVIVLIVSTILLPIKAEHLNSGKTIFTSVRRHPLSSIMRMLKAQIALQPDWLALGMGFLHDIPRGDVDAEWLRRRCPCC